MAKPICITQKKIRRTCKNIDPESAKAKALDFHCFDSTTKVSYQGRRFVNSKKAQPLCTQKLEAPKATFWGSAVDIEI